MAANFRRRKGLVSVLVLLGLLYSIHVFGKTFVSFRNDCRPSSFRSFNLFHGSNDAALGYDSGDWALKALTRHLLESTSHKEGDLRTDYFICQDFDKIPDTTQAIAENNRGNRGITFLKVKINGVVTRAVYKQANKNVLTISDEYKYNTAKREIMYLTKLQGMPGIPRLYGSCVNGSAVRYIVERISGFTLCNDNGTTENCSNAFFLHSLLAKSLDPAFSAIKLALSTARLFKLLEDRHLFVEDISGINLMSTEDWEVFLVDADSLVFYNESRIFSQLACTLDEHCPGPTGNLWVPNSLNSRIYFKCKDLKGICEYQRCRGFDNLLHTCGMSEWYICGLSKYLKQHTEIYERFQEVCTCMRQPFPQIRCSFATATKHLKDILEMYVKLKGLT